MKEGLTVDEAGLRLIGGSRRLFRSARVVVVAGHPDDEVIGCSALLARSRDRCTVIHVTDGAPRAERFRSQRYPTRESYAAARREEAIAALAVAGIPEDRCLELGFIDQEAGHQLAALTRLLGERLREIRPEIVVTHPYEGGHPDHDAASFAVHALSRARERAGEAPLPIVEFTSGHLREGRLGVFDFLPGAEGDICSLALDEEERARKQRMYACHVSQRHVLASFPIGIERLRSAPRYDFTRRPHPGTLHYETGDFGMSGERWVELSREAEQELGADRA